MSADDAINTISIGDRQSRQTKAMSLLDQLVGMTRPFQEGKITLAPKRNVGRHQKRDMGNEFCRNFIGHSYVKSSPICGDYQIKKELPIDGTTRPSPFPLPVKGEG